MLRCWWTRRLGKLTGARRQQDDIERRRLRPAHGAIGVAQMDVMCPQTRQALLGAGLPFLAICRGMQVLNVAQGGTLHQHLTETTVAHRRGMHRVTLESGCATALAMGGEDFAVSSYHHQALDRLGTDLRVVGRADDGCIEVVEHRYAPVLAVQWHPEDDADTAGHQQGLFDSVVAAADSRRRGDSPAGLADALRA